MTVANLIKILSKMDPNIVVVARPVVSDKTHDLIEVSPETMRVGDATYTDKAGDRVTRTVVTIGAPAE